MVLPHADIAANQLEGEVVSERLLVGSCICSVECKDSYCLEEEVSAVMGFLYAGFSRCRLFLCFCDGADILVEKEEVGVFWGFSRTEPMCGFGEALELPADGLGYK